MMNGRIGRFVGMTLNRPVTILMLLCSTILVGIIAKSGIDLELLPSGYVATDVSINIPVPNANPVEVEEQVTRPTEEVLRQISGLEEIRTRSSKNSSNINITFAKGRDPNEAFAEVRDLMELAKLSWPDDVQEYFTFRFNLDTDMPVLQFGVLLDEWESDTSFIIDEKIIKEVESVDGVARVTAWGLVEESVRIFVDKNKARALGISLFEVAQALGQDNRDVIGGRVEDGGRHFFLRSLGRFKTLSEVENYPLRPNLRLKEVAEVTTAKAYRNRVFRLNGKRSVWFNVNKESNANTVEVCRRIREKLDNDITNDPRLADKGFTWFRPDHRDFGMVIQSALSSLVNAALIGGLLAIIPLFLFLRRLRMTLIITLAIPTSLLITIACIYFSGSSLNVLSMLGITIAIGMLVDNSIVVVENIFRYRQTGRTAVQAALEGTTEVALAVTLATLTTVMAFLPLIFMDANAEVSFFSKAIGLPVCYAVLASLVVALLFIPLATVVLYRGKSPAGPGSGSLHGALSRLIHRSGSGVEPASWPKTILLLPFLPFHLLAMATKGVIDRLEAGHHFLLATSLKNRMLALTFIALGATAVHYGLKERTVMNPFADESSGSIQVGVRLESNFTLTDANQLFTELYQELEENYWEDLGVDFSFYWFNRSSGTIIVGLKDSNPEHTKMMVTRIKDGLTKRPGAKITVGRERQNADKSSLNVDVFGPEVEVLARITDELEQELELIPGVTSVSGGIDRESNEIVVEPDRERMQLFGIDPRTLMGTVQYGIRGQRLPDFHAGDQKMQMIIEFDDGDNTTVQDLEHMRIWSNTGNSQPLSNFANIYYRRGYGTIRKKGGQSSTQLTIETLEGQSQEVAQRVGEVLAGFDLPQGYTLTETSEEDFAKEMAEIMGTLLLAGILILLLMGVLFESVMLPLAVFVTIPFALLGGFWGLAITQTPLDMVGMIGAIVLIGIVVNNGIVFLDCAHRLVGAGRKRTDALLEAGRLRLRPILMTTATTVVGLLPMAMVEASGSFISYKSLARGVMGGLIVSTAATLVVVPIAYTLLDDLRRLFFELLGSLRRKRRSKARPTRPPEELPKDIDGALPAEL